MSSATNQLVDLNKQKEEAVAAGKRWMLVYTQMQYGYTERRFFATPPAAEDYAGHWLSRAYVVHLYTYEDGSWVNLGNVNQHMTDGIEAIPEKE